MEIKFNKYIVNNKEYNITINSKDIRILLNSDVKPIIIKTDEDENLIQLLLPIKTY